MDLKGSLFFHLHRVIHALHAAASTLATRLMAWAKGIEVGKRCHICGIPYLYRTPHSHIEMGDDCTVLSSFRSNNVGSMCRSRICTMTPEAQIKIGDRVGMSAVTITAHQRITIGDDTQIGAGTVIVDCDFHDVLSTNPAQRQHNLGETRPVQIGRNVFIGTRCIILKGVTIGDNAVIGAGSIVTKNIPQNEIAAGNPIRIIGQLDGSQGC